MSRDLLSASNSKIERFAQLLAINAYADKLIICLR